MIRFFTKKGEVVLDPFVGVGSTLKACAMEGRKGIGFELNAKYVALTRDRLRKELGSANRAGQQIRKSVANDAVVIDVSCLSDEISKDAERAI